MQQLLTDKIEEYGTTLYKSDIAYIDEETGATVSSPQYDPVEGRDINPDTGNIVVEKEVKKSVKALLITAQNEYNITVTDAEVVGYFRGDLEVSIGDEIGFKADDDGMSVVSIQNEAYKEEILAKLIRLEK